MLSRVSSLIIIIICNKRQKKDMLDDTTWEKVLLTALNILGIGPYPATVPWRFRSFIPMHSWLQPIVEDVTIFSFYCCTDAALLLQRRPTDPKSSFNIYLDPLSLPSRHVNVKHREPPSNYRWRYHSSSLATQKMVYVPTYAVLWYNLTEGGTKTNEKANWIFFTFRKLEQK